jgi:hypothetical protein
MLRIHAALCLSTGSLEMSVFHTLFAGKIGQFASVAAGALARCALPLPLLLIGTDAAATPPQAARRLAETTSSNGLV